MSKINLYLNLNIHEDGLLIQYPFSDGIKQLEQFQLLFNDVFTESFWLDEKMINLFTELNVYIINVSNEAKKESNSDDYLKTIAIRDRIKIRDISNRLNKQLREDLIDIHKIQRFITHTTSSKKKKFTLIP